MGELGEEVGDVWAEGASGEPYTVFQGDLPVGDGVQDGE